MTKELTFIVVEDHRLITDGITDLLQRQGLRQIGSATNAAELFHILRKLSEKVDVVFLDIGLDGGKQGHHIISDLKAIAPEVKVLMFTARCEATYKRICFANGADGFIHKKWDIERVLEEVKRAVMS